MRLLGLLRFLIQMVFIRKISSHPAATLAPRTLFTVPGPKPWNSESFTPGAATPRRVVLLSDGPGGGVFRAICRNVCADLARLRSRIYIYYIHMYIIYIYVCMYVCISICIYIYKDNMHIDTTAQQHRQQDFLLAFVIRRDKSYWVVEAAVCGILTLNRLWESVCPRVRYTPLLD